MVAKIQRLAGELTNEEKATNPRIMSFVNLCANSFGGSFDVNEHTFFFNKVHNYALSQLDSVYNGKYGTPLIDNPALREAVQNDVAWWDHHAS
ncbi:hypothetical protein AQ725_29880 [Burkholderia pseudomallei]|nr:hypothetical protein EGY14_31050 [Burkholderia pseudomallei]KVQ18222.1 hypothetical protein WJ98_19550 [Burkholderia ubonensis]OMR50241.1 hypothetical protein AQ725_29880 [Burkholderia pseudomallei]